jgi:DNA-binding LacI/PurR family transcriptional regulator
VEGEWSAEGGYAAAQQLLDSRAHFTAVVAANDQIALGLVEAFSEKGIQVPKDISVIGFDNMPESRFFRPPLTTVHHDFDLLGATSLRYVTEAIANPKIPRRHHKIAPELVIRESVSKISAKSTVSNRGRTKSPSA